MKPLLAHIYSPKRLLNAKTIYVQPKLNGIRALYQDGHFQSRDEQPWNEPVLRHLTSALQRFIKPSLVLDGELYVHGWTLPRINSAIAVNRLEPNHETHLVEYHIFDVVDFNMPFAERIEWVKVDDPLLHIVETHKVLHKDLADDYYVKFVNLGYEGMMYRLDDCPYTWPKRLAMTPSLNPRPISDKHNRCWHLLKRKDWHDDEFRCIDVVEGLGKRHGMVGAFVCITANGRQFSVGTGFTEAEAIHYFEHPPIGRPLKVQYLVLSREGVPLNPSLITVL